MTNPRRVKWYLVPEADVLDWFAMASGGFPHYLTVPVVDVPEDASVLTVRHDVYNRCFAFLVEHASFLSVAEGEVPPSAYQSIRRQTVEIVDFEK